MSLVYSDFNAHEPHNPLVSLTHVSTDNLKLLLLHKKIKTKKITGVLIHNVRNFILAIMYSIENHLGNFLDL